MSLSKSLFLTVVGVLAGSLLLWVTRKEEDTGERRRPSFPSIGTIQDSDAENLLRIAPGGAWEEPQGSAERNDTVGRAGGVSPPINDGPGKLERMILEIARPVSQEELLVHLHLLDQWSKEKEERIRLESADVVLSPEQKTEIRSYRAEPYDGVKSIASIKDGASPHVNFVAVEFEEWIVYEWGDGAFTKSRSFPSSIESSPGEVEDGGAMHRIWDWFASLWGG